MFEIANDKYEEFMEESRKGGLKEALKRIEDKKRRKNKLTNKEFESKVVSVLKTLETDIFLEYIKDKIGVEKGIMFEILGVKTKGENIEVIYKVVDFPKKEVVDKIVLDCFDWSIIEFRLNKYGR